MILIGTKSTHLTSVKASNRYCAACQKYETLILNVFRIQIHLFGIPIFPIAKTGNAFCQDCKKVLHEEAMSELILHDYLLIKNNTKGPTWQLSVGLLFLGAVIALSLLNTSTNQTELEYLASPIKGDVYEYLIDGTQYSTMKIIAVSADSLYIALNKHSIDEISHIDWIDKVENYQKNAMAFERQKINDMYNSGKILQINRKAEKVSDTL